MPVLQSCRSALLLIFLKEGFVFVELFVTQGGEESADERAIGRFRDQVRKRGRHNRGTFVGLFLLELPLKKTKLWRQTYFINSAPTVDN